MAKKSKDNRLLIYGGLLFGVYLLIRQFIPIRPTFPGQQYTGQDETEQPTLTTQRLYQLADIVYEALLGNPWFENEAGATAAICQCANDADLAGLIYIFGERSEPFWNAPMAQSYTLPGAIVRYYDADQLAELNACLAAKGINYQF